MNENLNSNETEKSTDDSTEIDQNAISLIPSSYSQIESYQPISTPSAYEQIGQNSITSSEKNNINENSEDKNNVKDYDYPADFFSMITFKWVFNTIKLIKENHKARFSYLGKVSNNYKSESILNEIKPIWYNKYIHIMQNNLKGNNNSVRPLLMTIVRANFWRIIVTLLIFFIMSTLDLFGILIFEELLGRFKQNKKEDSRWIILQNMSLNMLVFLMIIYKFLALILDRYANFISELLSFRTKAQLNLLIYDKLLRIPMFNTGKFNDGQIINLFQLDSDAFGELIIYTTYIIMVPFRVIYSIYLLFLFFKLAFIPGLVVLIISGVMFAIYGQEEENLHNENMKATDERMNITSRVFDMIKIIKLYSWEKLFKKKINWYYYNSNKKKVSSTINPKIQKIILLF